MKLSWLFCLDAATAFVHTGTTVTLGDVDYFISPYPVGTIAKEHRPELSETPQDAGFGLRPLTVVADAVSESELTALFNSWTARDDVFRTEFTETVLQTQSAHMTAASQRILSQLDFPAAIYPAGNTNVPSGPYFFNPASGAVYPVYRLYDDFSHSFTQSLLHKPDGSFQPLSAGTYVSGTLTIGVPSRLYFTPSKEKPLAGVRLGVKDIFHLNGTKTSNGNRAWQNLYPFSKKTTPLVQRLIDAGAVIVGVQLPTQFANGDQVAADWVDYHQAFNPRGDGYQVTSGSTTGGAVSIASYDWLDLAIGSDTGGSIRFPAALQGIYGNRPSQDIVPLDLVTPLCPAMDTVGLVSRDPALLDTGLSVLYGANYTSYTGGDWPLYPNTIYLTDFPDDMNPDVAKLFHDVISAVEAITGATAREIDVSAIWDKIRPAGFEHYTLLEVFNGTYAISLAKDQARLIRDPFFKDYAGKGFPPPPNHTTTHKSLDKNGGRMPFVNPSPRTRWAYGDTVPEASLAMARRNQTAFGTWFNQHVLSSTADDSCSSALLIYPGVFGKPDRVDTYTTGPRLPFFGTDAWQFSTFAGVPDIVIPIGEIDTFSEITGVDEPLPVAINVVAAKGCDGLLSRLAMDLVERGAVEIPRVGRSLKGGDILR